MGHARDCDFPLRVKLTRLSRHVRYQDDWQDSFRTAIDEVLRSGVVILDVGGGRHPVLTRNELPPGSRYIGIDLSRHELESAPADSYHEMIEADIAIAVPSLECSVDLAVSWQVLEHVAPLVAAVDNVCAYLRPGGRFVAHLSGEHAFFAVANRAVPQSVAKLAMKYLIGRDPESVFPARYDSCTYSGLSRIFAGWSTVRIVSRYRGAGYLDFVPPIQRVYLEFEDMMARGHHLDLATHYLVVADR